MFDWLPNTPLVTAIGMVSQSLLVSWYYFKYGSLLFVALTCRTKRLWEKKRSRVSGTFNIWSQLPVGECLTFLAKQNWPSWLPLINLFLHFWKYSIFFPVTFLKGACNEISQLVAILIFLNIFSISQRCYRKYCSENFLQFTGEHLRWNSKKEPSTVLWILRF